MNASVLRALSAVAFLSVAPAWAGLLGETPSAPEEKEVALPAFPTEADLQPFPVGGNTRNTFLLDRRSIAVEPDGVIRYTVVIRTPRGAENIIYEGMFCARGEARTYATGSRDGRWERSRHDVWQSIEAGYNGYRAALARYVFCDGTVPVLSADEAMRHLLDRSVDPDPVFIR